MNTPQKPDCYDIIHALLPRYEWNENRGWLDTSHTPVFVNSAAVFSSLYFYMNERGWLRKIRSYAIRHHRERVEKVLEAKWAPLTLELYCDMIRELDLLNEPAVADPVEVFSNEIEALA